VAQWKQPLPHTQDHDLKCSLVEYNISRTIPAVVKVKICKVQ